MAQTMPIAQGGPRPADKRKPRRPLWRTILSALLFIVAAALLSYAAFQWYGAQKEYGEQARVNEKLAAYAKVPGDGSQPPVVDWAGLKAVNGDVCAWLQIPGTVVNFPVYHGDTNEEYLRTSAEGTYSVGGQVFLDCENTGADFQDHQTIAYGHHLKDGSMFAQVADLDQQDFFDACQTVWWCTEKGNYELTPLFVYHVKGDDTTVRQFQWKTGDEFRSYLSDKLSHAAARRSDAEAVIAATERVLTLSTCNYIDGKGRTVVVCVPKRSVEMAARGEVVKDPAPETLKADPEKTS